MRVTKQNFKHGSLPLECPSLNNADCFLGTFFAFLVAMENTLQTLNVTVIIPS